MNTNNSFYVENFVCLTNVHYVGNFVCLTNGLTNGYMPDVTVHPKVNQYVLDQGCVYPSKDGIYFKPLVQAYQAVDLEPYHHPFTPFIPCSFDVFYGLIILVIFFTVRSMERKIKQLKRNK